MCRRIQNSQKKVFDNKLTNNIQEYSYKKFEETIKNDNNLFDKIVYLKKITVKAVKIDINLQVKNTGN